MMDTVFIIGLAVYVCCVIWVFKDVYHAQTDPHEWFEYVIEAAFREKKADFQRRFPSYRNTGAWVDFGTTTTDGFTGSRE